MGQEIAFAAPGTEEMTRVVAAGAGAGITGIVEGVIIKMAPELGVAQPILTWGTLLGIPLLGAAGALFTRGLLGDLFTGVACGGLGIVGYSLPEMLVPITGRRAPAPGGSGVKLLGPGVGAFNAPQRAQARVGIEF